MKKKEEEMSILKLFIVIYVQLELCQIYLRNLFVRIRIRNTSLNTLPFDWASAAPNRENIFFSSEIALDFYPEPQFNFSK